MAKPSKEYTAFNALMGDLLKVSKAALDAQVKAHQQRQAVNPRKAGRQRKAVTEPSAADAHGADAQSAGSAD
jgi:hypothetical protein